SVAIERRDVRSSNQKHSIRSARSALQASSRTCSSRMRASARRSDMHSLFIRIGALQVFGALAFAARAKIGALVLRTGGVGLVSVIDQFVLLMLQLFALAIPFSAVKVLSKAHSESIETFKAVYAGLLRLLLILGSIGAAVGIALFVLRPGWVSASLADHT